MRIVRFALVLVGVAFALPAAAQITEPTITDGQLLMQLASQNTNGSDYTLLNFMQRQEFFNLANCQCQTPVFVKTQLINKPAGSLPSHPVHFWVGQNCSILDSVMRAGTCVQFPALDKKVPDFDPNFQALQFGANQLMFPLAQTTCPTTSSSSNTVYGFIDSNGDTFPDNGGNFQLEDENGAALTIVFDTEPPSPVQSPSVVGVDNGFRVSWTVNDSDVSDLRGYQVLCLSQKTHKALFHTMKSGPEYKRAQDIPGCTPLASATPDGGVAPDAGVSGDAGTDDEAAFEALDPRFICAGFQSGGNSNGVRIDLGDGTDIDEGGADEGIIVKIVAIDTARNGGAADAEIDTGPVPAIDAWNYYHQQGGQAEGGYCFVATAAYGDYDHPYVKVLRRFRDETLAPSGWGRDFIAWYYAHSPPWADFLRAHPVARVTAAVLLFPVVVVAAVWNAAGVVGLLALVLGVYAVVRWRRRRVVRLTAAAAALVALVGIGGRAHAQSWLDEEEMANEPTGPKQPNWAFEIKLGPYFPHVDDESGLKGKPYATTFGSGSSLMAQIELDHYFFHPLGELGIGISAGYMSKDANAFILGMDKDGNPAPVCTDNSSMCRSADTTGFTMYPLALLAVYRFTMIADRSVVPVVPYAKLGLSYYIWRMTNFTGGTSSFNGNDGAGATLGWQGTIGISIRAERFDPESARALSSDLGVDHIGFFAELTFADVSGFGMDKKLNVGDTTWSAGLNFEF